MKLTDIQQITGDVTDATSGRISDEIPDWVRTVRVQVEFSDQDTLIDATIGGQEVMRDSAPHVLGADNLGEADWTKPYVEVTRGEMTGDEINIDINVVTAGTGRLIIEFAS